MSDKVRQHRRELLRMVMIRGGLSPDEMAETLGRNRRTVYRWLSGDSPVPGAVERWLLQVAPQVVQTQGVEP
jgi:DNA-binding XRE family transcriptional regulator